MRTNRHFNAEKGSDQRRRKMLTVLAQPQADDERPCRGCERLCTDHASASCTCRCTFACPDAPAALTSDPEQYPIEPRILPLVFELNALKVVQPCWSCEGHNGLNTKVEKLPSVWFYVDDIVYAELLNTYLIGSYARRVTQVPWIVTLSPGPEDTAFSCRPDLWGPSSGATLKDLQDDAFALAKEVREQTRRLARAELAKPHKVAVSG